MHRTISFPHMANYHVPIEILLKFIFDDATILPPPPITKKTLELGSRYSPDFVCVPFKYNLGNFIETLENGANILVQAGGGCRFGFYGELQAQILKDLGYEFEFITLTNLSDMPSLYKTIKRLGSSLSFSKFIYYTLLSMTMVKIIDKFEFYIRKNVGFEVVPGSFTNLKKDFFNELRNIKSFRKLFLIYRRYNKKLKYIKIDKPIDCLKVGMIGELYTLMEPYSNYYMEKELAKNSISVSRFITVSYLLFEKGFTDKFTLKKAGKYLKYLIGADGADSVYRAKELSELGYDGIIHVKPFGCTPEINAIPSLQNISNDYNIPILYFSFDSQTSETGIKTRLEAFHDMLLQRKEKQCKLDS